MTSERSLLLIDLPGTDAPRFDAVVRLGPWASAVEDPFALPPPDLEPYPSPEVVRETCRRSLESFRRIFDDVVTVLRASSSTGDRLPGRFWEFFLSYYLIHLAGIVEDVRRRCECLAGRGVVYGAPLNAVPEPPQSFPDYMEQSLSRSALRIRLTDVCARAYLSVTDEHPVMYHQDPVPGRSILRWASRCAQAGVRLGFTMLGLGRRSDQVLWDTYHLARVDVLRLAQRGVSLFSLGYRHASVPYVQPDRRLRERLFAGLPAPFGTALALTFPVLALEGLDLSLRVGRRVVKGLIGRTRRLYTFGRAWTDSEPIRAAAGLLAAEGASVVSVQHGGGFSAYDCSAPAYAEYLVSDRFVSWGWEHSGYGFEDEGRIVPMPSMYLSRLARQGTARGASTWQLLFLVCSEQIYPKWLYTPVFPEFAHEYFDRERVLLDGLRGEGPSAVKLYPHEFGWRQNEWIARRYPELELLRAGAFPRFARRARLCIADYNSTGFLELLAMRRPFMATWDRRWFCGTPAFERRLDALQEVGVFHEKPDGLIDTYYAIKPQIEAWWNEAPRRRVVEAMADEFARVSRDSLREWRRFMASAG